MKNKYKENKIVRKQKSCIKEVKKQELKKWKTREEKCNMKSSPVQNLPYPHDPTKIGKEIQYARFFGFFSKNCE